MMLFELWPWHWIYYTTSGIQKLGKKRLWFGEDSRLGSSNRKKYKTEKSLSANIMRCVF